MINKLIQNLTARLLIALTIIFLVFSALSAIMLISASHSHEQEVTQQIHRDLAQHIVDNYLLFKDGKPDHDAAAKTFHDLMILGANFELYLLDKTGKIINYDAKPGEIQLKSVKLSPIREFLDADPNHRLICGDDPKNPGRLKVFSVAPILQMGEIYGYLYVVIGSQTRDTVEAELWNSNMLYSAMTVLLVATGLALIALLAVVSILTRPLNRLIQQVQTLRDQGFEADIEVKEELLQDLQGWRSDSSNDIHLLGHTLAQTLKKLQTQYQNVVTIDDLRKELLSHVSHDLRTPLASLLGYLETWELQQESLSKEQSGKYISTARRSAQKIAHLIEQLFELAHLDGPNVSIDREPLAIAELVQDVLQKFSLRAQEQEITLDVSPQDSSIIVIADIEKLERVFSNLIENAMRHTPSGGKISVTIERNTDTVNITVSDTGVGIPTEDLPHVFEPHFKAQNSVRENTAHGGLGLAITRKLLALHESVIKVRSELNAGTSFSFVLQSA